MVKELGNKAKKPALPALSDKGSSFAFSSEAQVDIGAALEVLKEVTRRSVIGPAEERADALRERDQLLDILVKNMDPKSRGRGRGR